MGIGFHVSLPKTRLKFDSGNVTFAGWQVTLCDPMWHVSSRSGVASCKLLYSVSLNFTYLCHFTAVQSHCFGKWLCKSVLPSSVWFERSDVSVWMAFG